MRPPSIICVNGTYLPADTAAIPVADRGFRFGDGVFETIRLTNSMPYQWPLHRARLEAGLGALRIAPPTVDWRAVMNELVTKNSITDGFIRIAVSRGVGSMGYLPLADITATWVVELLAPGALPAAPLTLWQSTITRAPLSALPGNHKLAHGIGSTLALLEARDHGAEEALMLSSDGMLCEAASGNLFWITDDTLFTPALTTGCLAGTTRAAIMRLSPVACHEVLEPPFALDYAQAVFISNTRLGVWPVATYLPSGKHFDTVHPFIQGLATMLADEWNAPCAG